MFQSHCKWAVSIFSTRSTFPSWGRADVGGLLKKMKLEKYELLDSGITVQNGTVHVLSIMGITLLFIQEIYSSYVISGNVEHSTISRMAKGILLLQKLQNVTTRLMIQMWYTKTVLHNMYTVMHRIMTFWSTTEIPYYYIIHYIIYYYIP